MMSNWYSGISAKTSPSGSSKSFDNSQNEPVLTSTRTIKFTESISVLASPSPNSPQLLCASSTPWAVDVTSQDDFQIQRFDSFKNPIHSLFRSGSDTTNEEFFLAADSDRYINVYDLSQAKLVRTLVAGSGVIDIDLSSPSEDAPVLLRANILSVVTKDGAVELFPQPFVAPKEVNGDLKSSRKNLTKKASASVRLVSADSQRKHVPIFAASIQGPDLVIASIDSGVDLTFQKLRWQDEGNGELLFDGTKEVVKSKSASTLNTATLNGVKDLGKSHVDESKTVVVNGGAAGELQAVTVDISSSESEEEDEYEEETAAEFTTALESTALDDEKTSEAEADEEMADAGGVVVAEQEDEQMDDLGEPTFGELLASKHPNEISIASALPADASPALAVKNGQPVIPAGMSLGTVLTQALRSNDQTLLEACLHTLDITIVKNTIQRLDSNLAGILLSKLAERLASRPGRYGSLITWVQWTCIAHGGAIAAQPGVTAKVRTLYQVLSQRAKTLDDLLLLKGKLDMLDAQLTYRRQLAAQRPARREDRDEPGMIYIEGADNWDSDDDLDEDAAHPTKRARTKGRAGKQALENLIANDDEDLEGESEDDDPMVLKNGAVDSEDLDEEEDEDEDEDENVKINGHRGGLLDDEAEVSNAEDSDPDDIGDRPADGSSPSASSSEGDSRDEDDEDDEEDSDLDSFINDGSISFDDDDKDGIHVPGDSDVEEAEAASEPEPEPVPVSASKSKPKSASKSRSLKDKPKRK